MIICQILNCKKKEGSIKSRYDIELISECYNKKSKKTNISFWNETLQIYKREYDVAY